MRCAEETAVDGLVGGRGGDRAAEWRRRKRRSGGGVGLPPNVLWTEVLAPQVALKVTEPRMLQEPHLSYLT